MPPSNESTQSTTSEARVSFERLRERTDELELIISGLTTVTLLSLPGWMLDRYALLYPQLPLPAIVGSQFVMATVIGLCYVLGALFAIHVGIRAYWVGLIGLKSVFPAGIRWERAPDLGPITRSDLQRILPDIDTAIAASDRLASTLFAVIALGALSILWVALVAGGLIVLAILIGMTLGDVDRTFGTVVVGGSLILGGSGALVWLLDAVLAARIPRLAESGTFHRVVLGLRSITRLVFPERLISPVQLTLQTNTRPRTFLLAFTLALVAIPMIGIQQTRAYFQFDPLGSQRFITDAHIGNPDSMRSRYYESQLQPQDLRRLGPLIPDAVVGTSWMPLFLPYFAVFDDPVLTQLCGEPPREDAASCVRKLWRVELNGQPVALDGFAISERRDLGFRGLQGWIDLSRAKPGPQKLHIVWNPEGTEENKAADFLQARVEHHIPFLLAPEWGNDAPQSGD